MGGFAEQREVALEACLGGLAAQAALQTGDVEFEDEGAADFGGQLSGEVGKEEGGYRLGIKGNLRVLCEQALHAVFQSFETIVEQGLERNKEVAQRLECASVGSDGRGTSCVVSRAANAFWR